MTIIAFSGARLSLQLTINKIHIHETNVGDLKNLKHKEEAITAATVNNVIYEYNRHQSKDSMLNILIEQDRMLELSDKV